jgi:hypothetical protein
MSMRVALSGTYEWDLKRSEATNMEAAQLYAEMGNPLQWLTAQYRLVLIQRRQGRLAKAAETMAAAEKEADRYKGPIAQWPAPPAPISRTWINVWLAYDSGDIVNAQRRFEAALGATDPLTVPTDRLLPYFFVLRERGELAKARSIIEKILAELDKPNPPPWHGRQRLSWQLAAVLMEQGKLTEARPLFDVGRTKTGVSHELAALWVATGKHLDAEQLCLESEAFYRTAGAPDLEAAALTVRISALLGQARVADAQGAADILGQMAARSENVPVRLSALIAVARTEGAAGNGRQAERRLRDVIAEATKKGYRATALTARLALAELEAAVQPASLLARTVEDEAKAGGFGLLEIGARQLLSRSTLSEARR